ncbi:unnamed protein product, partial [marine sediment metagenome]
EKKETSAKSSEVIRNLLAILRIRPSLLGLSPEFVTNRQSVIMFLIAITPRNGTTKQRSAIDNQIPKAKTSSRLR